MCRCIAKSFAAPQASCAARAPCACCMRRAVCGACADQTVRGPMQPAPARAAPSLRPYVQRTASAPSAPPAPLAPRPPAPCQHRVRMRNPRRPRRPRTPAHARNASLQSWWCELARASERARVRVTARAGSPGLLELGVRPSVGVVGLRSGVIEPGSGEVARER